MHRKFRATLLAVATLAVSTPVAAQSTAVEACGAMQAAVLAELNRVRAEPSSYAAELRSYRRQFRDNLVPTSAGVDLITEEGAKPVDEAIGFLAEQARLDPLVASEPLAGAAADHCVEQAEDGSVGHGSADGSGPGDRMRRRGGGDYVGEVIAYGPFDAADVVRQLIVDDGVPDRGHRLLVFANDIRFAGVSCGPHPVYRTMCVIDVARTRDGRAMAEESFGSGLAIAAR